jgi:hypothetical protein
MLKKNSVTSTSLGLRSIVGGYLVYLAYSLIPAIKTASNLKETIFWVGIVALFFGVGGILAIFSVKALIKGEYDKGIESEESSKKDETKHDTEEKDDSGSNEEK